MTRHVTPHAFGTKIKGFLRRSVSIHGRERRRRYWIALLTLNLLAIICELVAWLAVAEYDTSRSARAVPLLLIVPTALLWWALIAFGVRRLHDIGLNGLWILLPIPAALLAQLSRGVSGPILLPAFASVALVLLALLDGTAGPNDFGDDPKGRRSVDRIAPSHTIALTSKIDRWTGIGIGVATLLWVASFWALGPLSAIIPTALAARVGDASVRSAIPVIWRCSAPGTERVLTQLAARLAPGSKVKITYTTLPGLFGMTFTGGRIMIGEGAVRVAERPEELAGLLAHELAHSALRHPERKLASSAILALLPRTLTAPQGFADWVWTKPYSRALERDADAEAARMMTMAGVAPKHLGSMLMRIDKIRKARTGGKRSWQATHPSTPDRIAFLMNMPPPNIEREAIPLRQQMIVRGGCQLAASSLPMAGQNQRRMYDVRGPSD